MILQITRKKGIGHNFHAKDLFLKPTPKGIEISMFDKSFKKTSKVSMELNSIDIIQLKDFLEEYLDNKGGKING